MRIFTSLAAAVATLACVPVAETDIGASEPARSGGTLFVANKRGASLSRIDLATGEETHRAETCENPHELTVSPERTRVLVACYSGRSVEVYLTADLSPVQEIVLGYGARVHSAISVDGDVVWAGAEGRGSLYNIYAPVPAEGHEPVAGTFEIDRREGEAGAHLVAVAPDGGVVWGTIIPTGEVVRYDVSGDWGVTRRRIGNQIEAIALSPDGESLWVSSNAESIAYRLDPMTLDVLAEVPTGDVPIRLAMHPSGDYVVSSNFGSGDLTVIDTRSNTVVRTISVSGSRDAVQVTLVFSADGTRLYAAETATDTIAEIDFASGEVLRGIATGPGGDGLAVID